MKKIQTEIQNRDSYQTGRTKPPKSYQGIIAVLLILVIFLGGIVSGLSMLNIRLFRMLEAQNQADTDGNLQFSRQTEEKSAQLVDGLYVPALGLTGHEVTALCRSYYGWPEGLYIASVTPGGAAENAGLRQEDILIAIDGIATDSKAALSGILSGEKTGKTLLLTVFRNGSRITLPLTAE